MGGNVYEWCATKWQGNYAGYRNDNDPEGNNPRILRGGVFSSYAGFMRCTFRYGEAPHYRRWLVGFRVVVAPGL
jgi:formylglycine-generating enzyme required for sulfatase activity